MSSKGKATTAPVATDCSLQAKMKVPAETREDVTEKGLGFLKLLTNAKDKSGHSISDHFLKLPSKDEFPDYYEFTKLPVALDTIKGKLERGEYPTMTTVESDLKRMVFNAKQFNEKTSELHRDAEKIRKMVTHHMKERKLNPAYVNPSYSSYPTPLPGEGGEKDGDGDEEEPQPPQIDVSTDTPDASESRPRRKLFLRGPTNAVSGGSDGAAASENEDKAKTPGRQKLKLTKPSVDRERLRRQSQPGASDSDSQVPKIKLRVRAFNRDTSTALSETEVKEEGPAPKRPKLNSRKQSQEQEESRRMSSSTPVTVGAADANEGFEGRSLQQAQEKIVQEMLDLESDGGETHIAGPFINLPPRDIRDYYQVVKHPLSLKGMMKLVRGVKGREKPTGKTFLPTWRDFDAEISFIWANARLYNEDGSEIVQLAGQLEAYCQKRVAQARVVIPDPPGTQPQRIKLHAKEPDSGSRLKLSAGNKRQAEEAGNYSVDTEALERQRQLVLDGVNGRVDKPSATSTPALARESSSTSMTGDRGIKSNDATTVRLQTDDPKLRGSAQTDVDTTIASNGTTSGDLQPPATAMMPPPPTTPLGAIARPPSQPKAPPLPQPRSPFDTWRRVDRPEALRWPYRTISEVIIASHPVLNLGSQAYYWQLHPWPEYNYAADILPIRKSSNHILVAPLFIRPTNDRPYVTTVVMLNGIQRQPTFGAPSITDDERPVYDLKLDMGDINEIEVQCFTQPTDPCAIQDVMFDKYTVVINPR